VAREWLAAGPSSRGTLDEGESGQRGSPAAAAAPAWPRFSVGHARASRAIEPEVIVETIVKTSGRAHRRRGQGRWARGLSRAGGALDLPYAVCIWDRGVGSGSGARRLLVLFLIVVQRDGGHRCAPHRSRRR